jgi:cytochrome c oxidase subunit II
VRRAFVTGLALLLSACDGVQSMTGGDGRQSQLFNGLFELFLWVTTVAYLLVIGFLVAAIVRRRGERHDRLPDPGGVSNERRLRGALAGWVGFILVGLLVLTVASYLTDRSLARAAPDAGSAPLHIKVTANQWWWDVEYKFADASQRIRTANELHLPLGVPAILHLQSNDVIHSFWVPNLAGKQDMIPGRGADLKIVPLRAGLYRAQCAEFCGQQHAHMALDVTVEPRADFDRWWAQQLQPAKPPATALARAGHDLFMTRQCAACHAIAGTDAFGQMAPDLTHFASRRSIAAGTLPNAPGHLYAWIADPQGVKPGNRMPYIGFEPRELDALVAYLRSLT